ncbi:MAG TPA: hypothetical protein VFC29_06200, partial [Candidatus Limnocylindrales bacterium]|nr:hypothetical protein [Candidatus Limnocylindrales bacterium]
PDTLRMPTGAARNLLASIRFVPGYAYASARLHDWEAFHERKKPGLGPDGRQQKTRPASSSPDREPSRLAARRNLPVQWDN